MAHKFLKWFNILFVMGPHANDFYGFGFFDDLVNDTVLDVYAAGIGAGKIADEFFIRRRG